MPIVITMQSSKNCPIRRYVKVLWQSDDTLMFIARGRGTVHSYKPVDEPDNVEGEQNLHFRTPEGLEDVAVLRKVRRFIQRMVLLAAFLRRICPSWRTERRSGETDSFRGSVRPVTHKFMRNFL